LELNYASVYNKIVLSITELSQKFFPKAEQFCYGPGSAIPKTEHNCSVMGIVLPGSEYFCSVMEIALLGSE
jgi:hypothetical protein